MKKDTALAALNFNYCQRERMRERCPFMSLELLSVSDVEAEPHIKVKVAACWQVTQNEVKSVYCIRMTSWTWPWSDPANEWTLASQISVCRCLHRLHGQLVEGLKKKMWQGQLLSMVDYLTRGNQLECCGPLWTFIHLADHYWISMMGFVDSEAARSVLMVIVLHSSKCIICLIQWMTLH